MFVNPSHDAFTMKPGGSDMLPQGRRASVVLSRRPGGESPKSKPELALVCGQPVVCMFCPSRITGVTALFFLLFPSWSTTLSA